MSIINDTAKTILCFGDSNTWGNAPRSEIRYPRSVRWPSALQQKLGSDFEIISEGLPGRTFVALEDGKPHRVGITHLRAILESADPIDLVILMLGTNDVKSLFNLSAEDISEHLGQTIELVQSLGGVLDKVPQILVVCPPPVIAPTVEARSDMGKEMDAQMVRGRDIFKELPALYKAVSQKYNCSFIDAGEHILCSSIDGFHLDQEGHLKLAEVFKDWITNNIE